VRGEILRDAPQREQEIPSMKSNAKRWNAGHLKIAAAVCAMVIIGASAALTQTSDLGIFTNAGSVGQTPPGCAARFDPATGAYTITGGGANVWEKVDAFYFVWKQASGDMMLTADVQWVGSSAAIHRKAMLMVRQSLDPGSAYADAVSHGNGLTSLQFRGAPDENTYEVFTNLDGPVRIELVRKNNQFTMYAGNVGGQMTAVGPVENVTLKDPVYVGIGVCSHAATALETAIFSNVKIDLAAPVPPAMPK
jgi:TolB protein